MTITGKYFKDIDDYVCAFGSNFSSAARVLTDYSVECQAPDLSRTTNFSVDLLHPYFQRLRGPSIQVSRIRVASIKPSAGPKTGGTVVTVFGENFDKLFHPLCVFGGLYTVAASTSADNTSLICVTPVVSAAARLSLQVQSISSIADSYATFQFEASARIFSVLPTYVCLGFPVIATITGTGFSNTTDFRLLSSDPTKMTLTASSIIVAQFPPIFYESVVQLSYSNDHQSYAFAESITVVAMPNVSAINPLTIPALKSQIDVTGAGFLRGFIFCRIGGMLVESTFSSFNMLSCMFNALSPGNMSFSLEATGGNIIQGSFRNVIVLPEFQVVLVEPSYCVSAGGLAVTIQGSGFPLSDDLFCSFGGMLSSPSNVSSSRIVCVVPEQRARVTYVSLLGTKSESQRLPFIITAVPVLHHLSPSLGVYTGGTRVTLIGGLFEQFSKPYCRFRSIKVRAIVVKDDTIICIAPPSQSKSGNDDVDVSISLEGDFFSDTSSLKFVYLRMNFHSAIPAMGPKSGGTSVIIVGNNIPNTPLLRCRFGNVDVVAQWNSDRVILCKSPPLLTSSNRGSFFDLSVSANLQDWNSVGIAFEYLDPLSAHRILPSFGPENSQASVTIFGTGFFASRSFRCKTGTFESKPVQVISSNMLVCVVPPSPAGEVSLFASPNSVDYQSL